MYNPLYYPQLNLYEAGTAPAGVHTTDNATVLYYQRMLYQRAMSVIGVDMPETWDRAYLMYVLTGCGYAVVLDSDKYAAKLEDRFGVIPQFGRAYGYNVFYRPRFAMVQSPLVQAQELRVGKDCELIQLTPDFKGIWDIVQTYAELLAECNQAASMSLQNSKLSKVFAAHNRSEAQVLKAMVDKVNRGELAVVLDDHILRRDAKTGALADPTLAIYQDEVAKNWVSDKALADYETILRRFDEEIGIPSIAAVTASGLERVTNDLVHQTDYPTLARIQTWMDCLEESAERVNRLFPGLGLKFYYRYARGETAAPDQSEEVSDDD